MVVVAAVCVYKSERVNVNRCRGLRVRKRLWLDLLTVD